MAEEIFTYRETREHGDIIEMRILRVPPSPQNPEGVSYSCVYIRDGKRLVGYDNFEGHEKEGLRHHRHIRERIVPYEFSDEWTLIRDFMEDVEKIDRGVIK